MIFIANDTDGALIPRVKLGEWIDTGFVWMQKNWGNFFDGVDAVFDNFTASLVDILTWPDALLLTAILAVLALFAKNWKLALLTLPLMLFIIMVDQWDAAMVTLASVVIATLVALLIGIPIGILSARSSKVSSVVRPVMDLLQTMPALVWLVPVVMLFGTGLTAAVIATLIFCLPPGVRLTELGIRQVDSEVVEAGHAFGSTKRQILRRIQLPLAMPTIMAGVNQVIMLALSMAVIAGFVGGGGLGGEVARAIGRLDIGLGFEAGLSVVALAIFLDRITSAISSHRAGQHWTTRLRRTIQLRRDTTITANEAIVTDAVTTETNPTEAELTHSDDLQKEGTA